MGGDVGGALDSAIAGSYKGGKKVNKRAGDGATSANRQYNDAKFGFGGKKRRSVLHVHARSNIVPSNLSQRIVLAACRGKQNDKKSANDMSMWSAGLNKAPVPGLKKSISKIGKAGGSKKRPGKAARQRR